MQSQAETIERFEPQTTAEILTHFEALERDVAREPTRHDGVRDLVLFRLRRWKNDVRLEEPKRICASLEHLSGLSSNDYAFAKRAYMTSALLLHRAIELAER